MIKNDNKGNYTHTCNICGKPITHSNKDGMFCDDECENTNANKIAGVAFESFFKILEKVCK